tara:strand:+ start:33 stop:563 length:531 start_codon:yes stop_codon:yes gene_type:complete
MALTKIRRAALLGQAGNIIQIQRTQFTGTSDVSIAAATDTVLTDLTVNITPTSTSSIIKIEAMVNGEWENADGAVNGVWFFYRDTTKLSHAAAGNRVVGILMNTADGFYAADHDSTPEHAYYSYFDTPNTTSQITYKVGVHQKTGYDWSLNKTQGDTDNDAYERGISNITVTEIAG